jgi:hypothetical protein
VKIFEMIEWSVSGVARFILNKRRPKREKERELARNRLEEAVLLS